MKWTVRVSITKNSKPIVIANRLYMYQFWPIICYLHKSKACLVTQEKHLKNINNISVPHY